MLGCIVGGGDRLPDQFGAFFGTLKVRSFGFLDPPPKGKKVAQNKDFRSNCFNFDGSYHIYHILYAAHMTKNNHPMVDHGSVDLGTDQDGWMLGL